MEYLKFIENKVFEWLQTSAQNDASGSVWGPNTTDIFREAQKLSDTVSLPSFWSYQKGSLAIRTIGQVLEFPTVFLPVMTNF